MPSFHPFGQATSFVRSFHEERERERERERKREGTGSPYV
jgi:hypothetical protein